MDIECCTKNVALKTENETQNREQWRHVFSDNRPLQLPSRGGGGVCLGGVFRGVTV